MESCTWIEALFQGSLMEAVNLLVDNRNPYTGYCTEEDLTTDVEDEYGESRIIQYGIRIR